MSQETEVYDNQSSDDDLVGFCPECGSEINLDSETVEGELVDCADCGVELEVVSINPLDFDKSPDEEEDWGE